MRTIMRGLLACLLAFVLVGIAFKEGNAQEMLDYEPAEIVVKLVHASDLPAVTLEHQLAATPLDQFGSRPIYRLQILDGMAPPDKAEALLNDPRVQYAEPNYFEQTPEGQQRISWARGGDAGEYAQQWAAAALRLPAAHAVTLGSGVVVAVLDTGVDHTHPNLAGRVLPGYDFVDMDADPNEAGTPADIAYGHGTHVAGLVALSAPAAHILPVRVLDPAGVGNIWVLAEALAYAVNPDGDSSTADGAHVINLSVSTLRRTELLDEILHEVTCSDDDGANEDDGEELDDDGDNDDEENGNAALPVGVDDDCLGGDGRGAVVVAAAGNRASTNPEFPAAEGTPGLLAVAAAAEDGGLADFSNHGGWVHVSAPGERILSSLPNGEYGVWSGTSMAAPLVAGEAALVRAAEPLLNAAQVAERIQQTATPDGAGGPPHADAAAALGM